MPTASARGGPALSARLLLLRRPLRVSAMRRASMIGLVGLPDPHVRSLCELGAITMTIRVRRLCTLQLEAAPGSGASIPTRVLGRLVHRVSVCPRPGRRIDQQLWPRSLVGSPPEIVDRPRLLLARHAQRQHPGINVVRQLGVRGFELQQSAAHGVQLRLPVRHLYDAEQLEAGDAGDAGDASDGQLRVLCWASVTFDRHANLRVT